MAAAKDATKEVEKNPTEGTAEDSSGGDASGNGSPSKKSLGPKEPPAFMWKLVGKSGGYVLTLFKAAEREDVEAQLQRLAREGYYQDLEILDINAEVKQSNPPAPPQGEKKGSDASAAKSAKRSKKAVRQPVIARPKVRSASSKSKAGDDTKTAKQAARKSKSTKSAKSAAKKSAGKKKTTKKTGTSKSTAKKSASRKAVKKKK